MDYSKIYINLMERSFERSLDCYVEKHHIVPKCMGGDNKPRNIAILTPEEHFLAHQLLVNIYPKNRKLTFAMNMMCVSGIGQKRSNKLYGWIRRKVSEAKTGVKQTPEHIMKSANGRRGRKHSEETKRKMSIAQKGKVRSEECRRNNSEYRKGKKHT